MKLYHYDHEGDKLVEETIYDPTAVIESVKELRQNAENGHIKIGKKGQELVHAARVDMDHIIALRNLGYDLLSADPAEVHRGLLYLRDHQQDFVVDKSVIADRQIKWA
jgi:hypothetical protein